jgi:EAL domain-containing protein (putative c-di-GMP-specific phosphodiesterase class I)
MSVNVAVTQLRHDGFPDLVRQALTKAALSPDRLSLELTDPRPLACSSSGTRIPIVRSKMNDSTPAVS